MTFAFRIAPTVPNWALNCLLQFKCSVQTHTNEKYKQTNKSILKNTISDLEVDNAKL